MFLKRFFIFIIYFSIIAFPSNAFGKDSWQLLFQPRQRAVKAVALYNNSIFAGTGNGLFISKNEGKTWSDFGTDKLNKDSNGNCSVNWIDIDSKKERIYIATSYGAYYSDIKTPNWKKIFAGTKGDNETTIELLDDSTDIDDEEQIIQDEDITSSISEINSTTIDNDIVYLSTNNGFWACNTFEAKDNSCKELNEGLEADIASGNFEVFFTLKTNDNLFLATSRGIYFFNKENPNWSKISSGIEKLPGGEINARHLIIDKENNLWAATGTGIYTTSDNGKTWLNKSNGIKKNNEGFQEVFFLFNLEDSLYAACASGIYLFDRESDSWKDLTRGIRTKENSKKVYYLAKFESEVAEPRLLAATDEGLFEKRNGVSANRRDGKKIVLKGKIETDFAGLEELEPSVIEVQKQALKFSALPTTNDYKRYRTEARLRNIIPKLGFDLNNTGTNTNYYQFNQGISANTSSNNDFNADKTNRYQYDGKSFKQLSVQWDTNQILYDDEIRFILNQARLTANIKENLLDDVTRIYFQRRKLQLETLLNPGENNTEKLFKQIEIAELTGQLDSRTGGWFSKEVEKRKRDKG